MLWTAQDKRDPASRHGNKDVVCIGDPMRIRDYRADLIKRDPANLRSICADE
jgi:hypothetical protein